MLGSQSWLNISDKNSPRVVPQVLMGKAFRGSGVWPDVLGLQVVRLSTADAGRKDTCHAGQFGEVTRRHQQERQNLAEAITAFQSPQQSHTAGFEVRHLPQGDSVATSQAHLSLDAGNTSLLPLQLLVSMIGLL